MCTGTFISKIMLQAPAQATSVLTEHTYPDTEEIKKIKIKLLSISGCQKHSLSYH